MLGPAPGRPRLRAYVDDDVRLRSCPSHQLAREHTELVCGMNLTMLTGFIEAPGIDVRPRLDPDPDRCCVAFDRG